MTVVIGQLVAVLREGLEGPPERSSYFTDSGPEAGLLGTLAKVNAAEASRPWGGSSIAAHVHHVTFGLAVSAAWIRGDQIPGNGQESWHVRTVDEATWSRLLEQLRSEYHHLTQVMETHASSSVEALGGAIGAIAHVAYHLGAIRQKIAFGRQPGS